MNMFLVKFLYAIFTIALWCSIIGFVFKIGVDLLTKDGTIMQKNTPISGKGIVSGSSKLHLSYNYHHKNGYAIPVNIRIKIPDSSITYDSGLHKGIVQYSNGMSKLVQNASFREDYLKEKCIPIKETDTIKTFFKNTWSNTNPYFEKFLLNENDSHGKATVLPKSRFATIILFMWTYFPYLFLILIFYQLRILFKQLKTKLDFPIGLSKGVKEIGIIVLLLFFGKLILSTYFVFGLDLGFSTPLITWEKQLKEINNVIINISPRLVFDYRLLITGVFLVILSSLFKLGYQIKQENDLTI